MQRLELLNFGLVTPYLFDQLRLNCRDSTVATQMLSVQQLNFSLTPL